MGVSSVLPGIQVDASQGGGGADTGVVSATTTTQRGAAWATARRRRPPLRDTRGPAGSSDLDSVRATAAVPGHDPVRRSIPPLGCLVTGSACCPSVGDRLAYPGVVAAVRRVIARRW